MAIDALHNNFKNLTFLKKRFTLYQVKVDGSASTDNSAQPAFSFSSMVYILKNSPLSPT